MSERLIHDFQAVYNTIGDTNDWGTTPRTVVDAIRDRGLNVRDYGAVGDNVANDTNAFQEAINDAIALQVPLFIPGGTYRLDYINLQQGLVLLGAGFFFTRLVHNGTGEFIRNNTGVSIGQVQIEGVNIVMNGGTTIGLSLSKVFLSIFQRIRIDGGGSTGDAVVVADGDTGSAFYNRFFQIAINGSNKSLNRGFAFINSANSNSVTSCRVVACRIGVGVDSFYTNHVTILDNAFEIFDIGVRLTGATGCLITGNRFENSGTANGIAVQQLLADSNVFIGNHLSANFFTNVATQSDNQLGAFDVGTEVDYGGRMRGKFFSQTQGGGWTTPMDMRNFPIENLAYIKLQVRTAAPGAATVGAIAYADGLDGGWRPKGDKEGPFVRLSNGRWEPLLNDYRNTAPTEGTWERGDVVYHRSLSTAAATNFLGWVCVTAGAPGVWKRYGVGQIES
ncbi:glycosyl hydrolase family 28-related protein [Bacillus thuringiensis]|uniref:glycosyl hydrolase family 28-related protein n=1 Tax=Bacillus thuringiensis TaxID=1428 RepID=UPI0015D48A80|nr:glycosyl hydrolase family 28-related protein [Bacillus thuringiensis]